MGVEDARSRRSNRLEARLISIRTGFAPTQLLSSLPYSLKAPRSTRKSRVNASVISSPQFHQALRINDDITLHRSLLNSSAETMAQDDRFLKVEAEVTALKTDVGDINTKLDNLIEAFAKFDTIVHPTPPATATTNQSNQATQNQPLNHSSSASPAQARNHDNPHNTTAGNQGRNLQGQQHAPARPLSSDEFLQREMDRDRFDYAAAGKYQYSNDFASSRMLPKPYMYLYREGVSTLKQKLDARQSMSQVEYIDAMLALMADNRACEPEDYVDIMHHLRKVTRDALERPWPAVRRWSQFVWDSIESGTITWADREWIQEERVRICLTSSVQTQATPHNGYTPHTQNFHSKQSKGSQEVVCRAYNTRQGFYYRESHMDGQVFALHQCTYCDSLGRACMHSVRECERRLAHTRNDHGQHRNRHQPYNNYNQQNQQQSQMYHQSQYNHQGSKNGE